jgi:hypothetical protein
LSFWQKQTAAGGFVTYPTSPKRGRDSDVYEELTTYFPYSTQVKKKTREAAQSWNTRNLTDFRRQTQCCLSSQRSFRSNSSLSLPKTPSMNSFLFYISEKLSCAPVLMVKTTDMRNCHDLSLFWRLN